MSAAPVELFEEDELDEIRSNVVALWAGLGVAPAEIGRRLGRFEHEVVIEFWRELALGPSEWEDPKNTLRLYYRARGGDAGAAMLCLFAVAFDHPAIAHVLARAGCAQLP
jgi:hypothetical protein